MTEPTVHPNGHDADAPETAAAPRRPFLPVALGLAGLVVVVLVAAFVLDRQYRKPVGIEPAPPIAVQTKPTAVPVAARAAPTTAPVPTAVPTATTAPTAAAVPTLAPAAAAGAAVAAPAQPTVDPLQREIAEAYLRYWQVRKEAYLKMDPALLDQVMSGSKLDRERGYMQQLKANGQGARIEATHKFVVVKATPDEALVYDEYVNQSPLIDLATGKELPVGTPETEKISVTMKKIDGTWKVVEGAFHD